MIEIIQEYMDVIITVLFAIVAVIIIVEAFYGENTAMGRVMSAYIESLIE